MSSDADYAPRGDGRINVRLGRIASVDVYMVKEGELEKIESGLKGAEHELTYANILITAGITCIAALAAGEFKWDIVRLGFLSVAIFGTAIGIYFLRRWRKHKSSTSEVVDTIRERIRNGNDDPNHQPSDSDASPS